MKLFADLEIGKKSETQPSSQTDDIDGILLFGTLLELGRMSEENKKTKEFNLKNTKMQLEFDQGILIRMIALQSAVNRLYVYMLMLSVLLAFVLFAFFLAIRKRRMEEDNQLVEILADKMRNLKCNKF